LYELYIQQVLLFTTKPWAWVIHHRSGNIISVQAQTKIHLQPVHLIIPQRKNKKKTCKKFTWQITESDGKMRIPTNTSALYFTLFHDFTGYMLRYCSSYLSSLFICMSKQVKRDKPIHLTVVQCFFLACTVLLHQ